MAIGKPMPRWLIRKRSDSGWTIWQWRAELCCYVAAADTPTGAQAHELFAAGAL